MSGWGPTFAILNAVTWGIAVVLFRRCGESTSPLALSLFKNCLALVLFVVTLAALGIEFFPDVTAMDYALLLASGVCGLALSDTLVFRSLNTIGASNWAILDCLYSPLLIAFGYAFLSEDPTPKQLIGGALVVSSTLIVSKLETEHFHSTRAALTSVGIAVLAVLLNVVSLILAKPVLGKTHLLWATTVRLIAGIVPLAMLGLFRRDVWSGFRPKADWKWLIPATVMGNYVALIFWIAGMKYASVGAAGILNKLSTVVILLLSVTFLKESLTPVKILAALLGIAGAILVLSP